MWRAAALSAAKPPSHHRSSVMKSRAACRSLASCPPLPPPWRCRWDNIQPTTATGSRLPLVVLRGGRQLYWRRFYHFPFVNQRENPA